MGAEVCVLGETYKAGYKDFGEQELDGYCDESVKEIWVRRDERPGSPSFKDYAAIQRKIMRHEIVHAFFLESGLGHTYGNDEALVDWIAVMVPKMVRAFEAAGSMD